MVSRAEQIFNIFEESIPEYYQTKTIRSSQIKMVVDVAEFLHPNTKEKFLFIEGPVGTGKSLGALVPALIESKISRARVVYATATINLQGQLMNSEVPLMKQVKMVRFPLLAKGKSHYYCHKEYKAKKHYFTPQDQNDLTNFYRNANTGLRNELEDEFNKVFSEESWNKVALQVSKKECDRCEIHLTCPSNIQRSQFLSPTNDLIITNHDQLIQSVLNQINEPYTSPIIPTDPGIIIIDEAHHFQENYLGRIEKSVNFNKLNSLLRFVSKKNIQNYNSNLKEIRKNILDEMQESDVSSQGRYPISRKLRNLLNNLNKIIKETISELETQNLFGRSRPHYDITDIEEISYFLESLQSDNYVSWINYDELKFSSISRTFPTEFRKLLRYLSIKNKIIIMSGTLTSNGDFETLINQWRLNSSEVITKQLKSPFDYKNQALIYVPKMKTDPRNQYHIINCTDEIKKLIKMTKGSSLILTTAKDHITKVKEEIRSTLDELDIRLLVQDESGVEKLTKEFREDTSSVLLGSGSFFSGFSVPGPSLTSVILTKLPFPVPNDPFLELIGEGYEDEFFDFVTFPHMLNKLNQAAGRLIRDIKDYGLFTVLDPRIFTEQYGSPILSIFEKQGYRITRSYEEVEFFIKQKVKKGSEAQYLEYNRSAIDIPGILLENIKKEKRSTAVTVKVRKKEEFKITKEQKEYAKAICEKESKTLKRGLKTSDQLFKFLIDIFCIDSREDTQIRDNFPYQGEEEKTQLLKTQGTTDRNYKAPNCKELFNCTGNCDTKMKEFIKNTLIENGAKTVNFYHNKAIQHCIVLSDPPTTLPQTILDNINSRANT